MDRSEIDEISTRIHEQRERIARAAARAGRSVDDVILVAVSKLQSVEKIRAAYAAGQRDFGENYVQELAMKAEALRDLSEIRWHFIGHLQTNKAKYVARLVRRVHTVCSAKVASELGRRVAERRRTQAASPGAARAREAMPQAPLPQSTLPLAVLVEVNLGAEASKSGCLPADLGAVLDAVDREPHLALVGLMAVPPRVDSPEDSRGYIRQLMRLRDEHGSAVRLPEISFGMSDDAEIAVEEGTTYVRIGTAIFGPRDVGPEPAVGSKI
jgi:pyridoxal phosphate enzyme (YggS family)